MISYWSELRRNILNDKMSPNRVAAGWALGMFIGCAVPFGFQLALSIPLAILFKVSKIGATVGTLLTNPVTIFFIYPAQTLIMFRLLFWNCQMGELPKQWTFENVMAMSGELITSFFLGGIALAFILTPITYFLVKLVVTNHRRQR